MKILLVIGWQLVYTWCVLVLLGVWSITSGIVFCYMICSVCCAVSSGAIGATGVGAGLGYMMLVCVRCSIGTCVTYSSLSSMRCGCVFWDGVGLLTLDLRRSFTGTFLFLPRIVYMCPIMVALELGRHFRGCFVVKVEKVVRYPPLISCSSVVIVGEKRDK